MPTKRLFSTGRALLQSNVLSIGSGSTPPSGGDGAQWWPLYIAAANTSAVRYACPINVPDRSGANTSSGLVADHALPITANGNLTRFRVNLGTAPGAGKSWRIQVVINGVASTSLDITIADSATSGTVSGTVAIADGDLVAISITPSGTPASTTFFIATKFIPTTINQFCYGGLLTQTAFNPSDPPYSHPLLYGAVDTTSGSQGGGIASTVSIAPFAGTLRALRLRINTAPGVGKSLDFKIRVNGVDASSTLSLAGTNTTAVLSGLSISVSAGDQLSLRFVSATSGSAGDFISFGVLFEPSVSGRFAWGGSSVTTNTSTTRYLMFAGSQSASDSGTEADVQFPSPADLEVISLASLYEHTPSATTFTMTTRVAGADGALTTSVTGSTVDVLDDSHSDSLATDEVFNLSHVMGATNPGAHVWAVALVSAEVESTPSSGDGSQWWLSTFTTNHFFGPPANPQYATVTDGGVRNGGGGGTPLSRFSIPLAAAGEIQEIHVKLTVAPGTGKSWTFHVGTTSVTISDTATTGTGTGSQHYNAGDPVVLQIDSSGDPPQTIVTYALKFMPDTDNQYAYGSTYLGSSLGSPNGPPYYVPLLHGRMGNTFSGGNSNDNGSVIPIAGTIRSLYVAAASAPGGGGNWVFTIIKNGSSTGITVTLSGASTAASATGLSIAVAAGDLLQLKADKTSSPSDIDYVNYGVLFEPDVAGQFLWLARADNDTIGDDYRRVSSQNSATPTSGTESDVQLEAPADFNIVAFAMILATTHGTHTFTHRINGVDGSLSLLISGSTSVVDTGSDSVVAGDLLSIKKVRAPGSFESGGHTWSLALVSV